jgi:hypothetical protein
MMDPTRGTKVTGSGADTHAHAPTVRDCAGRGSGMARLPLVVLLSALSKLCGCVIALGGADVGPGPLRHPLTAPQVPSTPARMPEPNGAAKDLRAGLNASAGFHYLTTGPCTANDNEIFHYGSRMAASKTLLAVRLCYICIYNIHTYTHMLHIYIYIYII